MLMPDPKVLRSALTRFADARVAHARHARPGTEQELRDTAYTLCVMTGTRTVREALSTADQLLAHSELPAGPTAGQAPEESLPLAA